MGFFWRIRARLALLFALCLFVAVFAVPASAQEEYRITATLQAPEPEEGAVFGGSVAVSGDIVAVGEPLADVEDKSDAGRAYIFDSDGNPLETLQAPEPEANAGFGWSVAVSGDVVAVGEPMADVEDKFQAGRVYIFDPEGNLLTTLQSPEPGAGAWFGCSVSVSGDVVAVGEFMAEVEGKSAAGRAYIFDSSGNLLATLQSPKPKASGKFGWSVAVSEDVVVVSEEADVEDKEFAGRAYIFDSSGNLLATLQSPEPEAYRFFGWSVAVSGDIVAVGEPRADVDGKGNAGRVYIFDPEGNLLATLQSPTPQVGAEFYHVAVSGDVVVVSEEADVEGKRDAGRAYIFDSDGNLLATLQSPTPQEGAEFGGSHTGYYTILYLLAVSGDVVVIGERGADVEGVSDAGRAYIIRAGGKTLTPSPTPTPTPSPTPTPLPTPSPTPGPTPSPTPTSVPTADYAPYLVAAAVIVVVVVATAVYVKRRKRQ